MALTKAQRTARASKAAHARWEKQGEDGKRRQRVLMISAQAEQLGYRLVPADDDNEEG